MRYTDDKGATLVVQSSEASTGMPSDDLERAIAIANATGVCSVCATAGFARDELDASGRCDECRP